MKMKPRNIMTGQEEIPEGMAPIGMPGVGPWAAANASPIVINEGSTLVILRKNKILQEKHIN